ncbi:MAG: hypothetical protein J6S49_08875 [Erysipelotrichaceae bacterium]|nr:hypothetical protein [Erysipelotrichaceae bacterium]MBP5279332.1 hypothetical protein [Erysipelotrichaceae bacterium]
MLKFDDLLNGMEENQDRLEDYFAEFFTRNNYRQYETDGQPDKDESKAIRVMFESRKKLRDRCLESFTYDPFCLEAFFVYYIISEDIYVNYVFKDYYNDSNNYADFSDYQKKNYLKIMDFYVEFLLDINNFTTAIKVQRLIIRLTNDLSSKTVSRLSYMYSAIEQCDDFYRLYLEADFDTYDYLMLLVTLLKHEEDKKAREVLLDMYENIEYSDHLDHLWDLELDDPKQEEFYKCVEDCYSELRSIPDFFAWVNLVNEERQ